MEFMKYSNEHQVNIIPKDGYEELVHDVFNIIASNMAKSLGPLGSSSMIIDGMSTEATKDGFAILKNIRFHNRYKRLVYNLIKAPCTRLNNSVGDGTTTAIVFANNLFQTYEQYKSPLKSLYRLPREFTKAWDECVAEIIEGIKKSATFIEPGDTDSIYRIAYVTSNGDAEVSQNIADIYKKTQTASIRQKDSPTNKSYVQPITGFEFKANLIDEAYAKSEDLSVKESDIHVLIFDHKVESEVFEKFLIPMNDYCRANNRKLLVLAPYYDALVANTTMKQYVNHEYRTHGIINLIFAQYEIGKLKEWDLKDLATILKGDIITQETDASLIDIAANGTIDKEMDESSSEESILRNVLGHCKDSILSCTNGSIFQQDESIFEDHRYQEVLNTAKAELNRLRSETEIERQSYSFKISEANARIAQLEMKNYIYYVGANSSLQKRILWDSIEDVIKCVSSAIKHGIVPGCQLSIIRSAAECIEHTEDPLKTLIYSLIMHATTSTYVDVLVGPNNDGILNTMEEWRTLDDKNKVEDVIQKGSEKLSEIVQKSIESFKTYDLESMEINDNVFTSAETDELVLLAASELVKILISNNQCIFLDAEVNESHQEQIEM
jgi:60 kDa chaperonin 1